MLHGATLDEIIDQRIRERLDALLQERIEPLVTGLLKEQIGGSEIHPDTLLTPAIAASLLGTTPATLATGRCRGEGPHYIKRGHSVRYLKRDLDAYIEARRRRSTSEAGNE